MTLRSNAARVRTVAMLGNHAPRQCGIATFTTHLAGAIADAAPDVDCFVVAMNDAGARHEYPPRVRFELAEGDLASYWRAADFLNVQPVDVVSVQHEFGIFGGKAGAYVIELLRELRMPIVTTLHTILDTPDRHQRTVLDELLQLSARVVVMSEKGREILRATYGVVDQDIDFVPHGIPAIPLASPTKARLGIEGKAVLLTFGLLSPDKGIEHVIDALPEILARHPDTIYLVVGATHPHVKAGRGEAYRIALQARARQLGVDGAVMFHDRFVTEAELGELLAAADIYVTPYVKETQITSGTLAYAIGAGKAVISTPYWYATELLADRRGVLVPFRDPGAIARAADALLSDEATRRGYSERASAFARDMGWPSVAAKYLASFERACSERASVVRSAFQARTLARRPVELPEPSLVHLRTMTDDTGLLQHARYDVPSRVHGYCLDDNARALRLMALLADAHAGEVASAGALATRYLGFVDHAFDAARGRFRNFMSYERAWLEVEGSEDSHARAVWALGTAVGRAHGPSHKSLVGELFHAALPATRGFTSPRAWAFTLLGIDEYLWAFEGESSVEDVRSELARQLLALLPRAPDGAWPWFEESLTYDNARLPQALIASGARMRDAAMRDAGLRSLRWLASIQRTPDGYFAPIGSNGFFRRGGPRAEFDQQPIEACAMVAAALEASRATDERGWREEASRAFAWFLGQNQRQVPLYVPATGGCRDGLQSDGANENQGAESTVAYLTSLVELAASEHGQVAASAGPRSARRSDRAPSRAAGQAG